MAIQISYPSLQFGPYLGGVNYAQPAEYLRPEEAYSMQSTRVDIEGGISKRGGILKHNTTAMNSGATVVGCGQVAWSPTSDSLFAVAGSKFYEDASINGTFTDRTGTEVITAGNSNLISHAFGQLYLFITNGVDAPLVQTAKSGNLALADVDARFTTAKFVAHWDSRIWWGYLTVGTLMPWRIWRSDAGDVTIYGATNFHNIHPGEVEITAMVPMADFLCVHYRSPTKEGIAGLVPQGLTATPYVVRYFATKATVAPNSVQNLPGNRQIFVRSDGVYIWSLGSREVTKVSKNLDGPRYWDNISKANISLSHSMLFEAGNEYWVTVPYGSVATPNHTLIFDYVRNIWYGPFLGYTRASSCVVNRQPYMGDFAGFLQQHEKGDADNAAAIDGWFYTAALQPDKGIRKFRWMLAEHSFDALGNWYVTVRQVGTGGTTESFRPEGTGFDTVGSTFTIAQSAIGGGGLLDTEVTQLLGYDQALQLQYRNTGISQPFTMRRTIAWYKPAKES